MLGYECARSQVYTFRGLDSLSQQELDRRIRAEQRKAPSDQGPRTFARDLRRTLQLMGLIHVSGPSCEVSPIGQRLLQFPPGALTAEYVTLWKDAILRITLPPTQQQPQPLRPAPIMLRIMRDFPGIEKQWLALAFEARNNSEREYRRIQRLIQSRNFAQVMRRTGATDYQAANAIKIIPALMEQVGLIQIQGGICSITEEGQNVQESRVRTVIAERTPYRQRSPRLVQANVHRPEDVPLPPTRTRHVRNPEVIGATLALLDERTREHQQLLRNIVSRLRNVTGLSATRDRYDLLASSTIRGEVILFEVKTGEDYLMQSRLALGQLCQYEFFDVRPCLSPDEHIIKSVVFGGEPGQDIRDFLNANGVLCVSFVAGTFIVPQELADYFQPNH